MPPLPPNYSPTDKPEMAAFWNLVERGTRTRLEVLDPKRKQLLAMRFVPGRNIRFANDTIFYHITRNEEDGEPIIEVFRMKLLGR